ncbi:MAG: hypothetical protein ACOCVG_03370, partial [Verrucomicrobiota bacterium]
MPQHQAGSTDPKTHDAWAVDVLERLGHGVLVTDIAGKLLYANNYAREQWKIAAHTRSLSDWLHSLRQRMAEDIDEAEAFFAGSGDAELYLRESEQIAYACERKEATWEGEPVYIFSFSNRAGC